jgi:hypothetical protein
MRSWIPPIVSVVFRDSGWQVQKSRKGFLEMTLIAHVPRELRPRTLVSSFRDSSCHQRLIKLPILRVIEVRIMPQQGEIAAISQRPAFEGEHQVQRLVGVA